MISLGNGRNPAKIRTSKQTRVHMQSLQHQVKEQHFVISMRMLASYEKVSCIHHKKGNNPHNPQKTKGIIMSEKYVVIPLSRSERIHIYLDCAHVWLRAILFLEVYTRHVTHARADRRLSRRTYLGLSLNR